MEPMTISVLSVVERDGHYITKARATTQDARIDLEVSFEAGRMESREGLWREARVQVLRFLDIA